MKPVRRGSRARGRTKPKSNATSRRMIVALIRKVGGSSSPGSSPSRWSTAIAARPNATPALANAQDAQAPLVRVLLAKTGGIIQRQRAECKESRGS